MLVTLETAKQYLRVDSDDEDSLIESLLATAEKICGDVLRTPSENSISDSPENITAVLYALAYLYEHREQAEHQQLLITLRALLGGNRTEVF